MLADVDVSLRQPRSTDEYRATIDGIGTEIERLGRLADQLLVLARADAGALVPRFESIDLPDFLEEAVARWRPLIEKRGLRVTTALPDVGTIDADGELIRRVIDNLLDNAAKYTPAGGAISAGATHENGWWRIEVADTGPGIPDAVRDIVFERFSRGDPARARDSGGAGLGLALCAAIAQAHGGSITLGEGRGARMTVTLPASHR
jgi:signal transduction histidine kinase